MWPSSWWAASNHSVFGSTLMSERTSPARSMSQAEAWVFFLRARPGGTG